MMNDELPSAVRLVPMCLATSSQLPKPHCSMNWRRRNSSLYDHGLSLSNSGKLDVVRSV